ncbi:hypothetical protein [Sporosarcina aquimarina]|uniref:Tissue inhibitor of metalloproteinase n=1 Tax=Sporosarcina aquimarina TaxID=114975 RepID=A0ABU4FZZ7_9BACL|nr:hypothetical protein [Sporosarcina aquimarina]MDW0110293.1 hypothetical protein [Sporosarcina aquimarina]
MNRITLFLSMFLLMGMMVPSNEVKACSCIEAPPVSEAVDQSDAVFLGTVTSIKELVSNREVTIEVKESWKGVESKTLTVYTGFNSADCGLTIDTGEKYLFYANKSSEDTGDPILTSSFCSRTATELNASEDLKVLGAGQKEFTETKASTPSEEDSNSKRLWVVAIGIGVLGIIFIGSWIIRSKRN